MAVVQDNSYQCESGGVIVAGRSVRNSTIRTIRVNGIQTIGSGPLSVMDGNAVYAGWVASNGDVGVSRYDFASDTSTSYVLSPAFEQNAHDNATVFVLPDGRLICAWSKHNEAGILHYRVSVEAGDISAWEAERTLSFIQYNTYNRIFHLSSTGKTYISVRAAGGPEYVRSSSDLTTWETAVKWISSGTARVYPTLHSNGVDRVDMIFQNVDVVSGQPSVYHAYMQVVGGVETFFKSDGTLIGTTGVTPSTATLVYDGAINDAWSWDIKLGSDGLPRGLFTQFRSTSDHRIMHARWTGSEWVVTEVASVGGYLYAAEPQSDAQACFDAMNLNIVYLAKTIGAKKVLQEWRTSNNGASWSWYMDITAGLVDAFTPSSPRNHGSRLRVVWNDGTITAFTSGYWTTSLKGV